MSRMIDNEEALKDNGLIEIDDCNVAECNSFLNEYEFPNNLKGGYYKEKSLCECGVQGAESYPFFCKDNPDCYFKQLQRAKAENERLKAENEKLKLMLSEKHGVYR